MTQTPAQPSPQPPVAKKIPALRTHHGDAFEDNYEWLRDKESAEVVELLKAENAYQEAVTAHQEPLREAIFQEIKGRTQETDLSVPNRKDGWWYYTRSVEGTGIRHPVPRPGRGHRGPRRRLDSPRRRGRRRDSGRGNPAGRQRRGGGQAVLRRRRCRRDHRREPLRLRRGQRRGRAVHAAHQGPADRGAPPGRDRERLLRHLLLPRRHAGSSTPWWTIPGGPTR